MVRTRVKICGMTRESDALLAAECGVDALGFIFYEKSPRNIHPDCAAEIIARLPPLVDRVGVFVNADFEQVELCVSAGLSYLQLHGTETPEYCAMIKERFPNQKIIKAFRVSKECIPDEFLKYEQTVDCFLLDTYVQGEKGGTGVVFDWTILDKLQLQKPVFLAGGLSLSNVVRAIDEVHPYCLDVNSGIEVSPGIKDPESIKELFRLVGKRCG